MKTYDLKLLLKLLIVSCYFPILKVENQINALNCNKFIGVARQTQN